jgi:Bifunctional DNA primase/polymerase, N-terminal
MPAAIRAWFVWPNANIGLVTDSFVVADVDPRHHGAETMRKLVERYGPLPATWRVFTGGGGVHVYFKPPDGVEITSGANRLGQGVDIRARGGYVILPPSNHVSGKCYRWHAGGLDQPLAYLPAGLLHCLQQHQHQQ